MENKIIKFLNDLLVYDWKKLDTFEDLLEQSDEYQKILDQFRDLISQESQVDNFNFDDVYELLNTYTQSIQNIMYVGKLKHLVNTHLLPFQLKKIVEEIDFEIYQVNKNFPKCECEIRAKFNIEPKTELLTRLGENFDGYYTTYIYKCQICEFGWMVTDVEETGIYEIWNPVSHPINNPY